MEIEKIPAAGTLGSFNQLDVLAQEAPYAIAVCDRDMRYLLVNSRWINDYGLTGKDVIGRTHYEMLPDMPESWKAEIRRVQNGETFAGNAESSADGTGKRQMLSWKMFPWYEANDPKPAGIVIMTNNILYTTSVASDLEAQSLAEAQAARYQIETIASLNTALSIATDEEQILAAVAGYAMTCGAARMLLSYAEEVSAKGEVTVNRVVTAWAGDKLDMTNPMLNRRMTIEEFPFMKLLYHDADSLLFVEDLTTDPQIDDHTRAMMLQRGVKSSVLIPFYSKTAGRWQGSLTVLWTEPHKFTAQEKAIFNSIGLTASAIVSSRRAYLEVRNLAATLEQQVQQRTEELRQSQRLMRQVIDGVPALIFAKDRDSRYTLANKALSVIHGVPTEKIVGMGLAELGVKPDEMEQFITADRRVIDSREPVYIAEEPLTGVDGVTRWMQTTKLPIINDDGTCTNLLGIAVDITDLKKANEAIREANTKFDIAMQGAQLGLGEWNLVTNAATFSEQWTSMFGYKPADIEPSFQGFSKFMHPDDLQRAMQAVELYLKGEKPYYNAEFRVKTKDDKWKWAQIAGKTMRYDAAGNPLTMVGILQDIDERKRAEEIVKEASERFDIAMQGAELGLWEMNLATGTVILSERWAAILGYKIEELEQTFELFSKLLHPDDFVTNSALIERYFKGEIPTYRAELRFKAKDGSWKWVFTSGKIMSRDANGAPLRVVGILQDIDERKRAEQDVQEASERFDMAMQGAELGLWEMNLTTGTVIFSERWAEILGYRANELEHNFELFSKLLHPDDYALNTKVIERYFKGEIPSYNIELRFKAKNGNYKWVFTSGKIMERDANGMPTRVVGILQDIDERKRTEQAVQEANLKFDVAIQGAQLGLWDWNMTTNELVLSERWCEMLGYRVDEVEESVMGFISLLHPDDRERMLRAQTSYLSGESPNYNLVVRMKAKDGSWKHVLTSAKVMGDGTPENPKHLIGVNEDITERVQAELAVQEANLKFDVAIQGAELGLWEWNLVTNEMQYSDRMYAMLDYLPGDLKNHIDGFTALIHADDLPRTTSVMDKYVNGEITGNKLQFRMKMRNGEWKWVTSSGKALERDANGKAVRMVGILEDINAQKVSERERERLIRQLREASRYKDEFFAVMSHELRTPLNAMIGLLGIVLMKNKVAADDANMITRARANSDRLLTLINNILDISRMEAGRLQLTPTDVNIRRLVDKLNATMGVLAEQKHVAFNIKIDEEIPETLLIDEDATIKIISNLIGNAFKFTDSGSVNLTITPQGNNIAIEVRDTGAGIPAHMHEIIFESFRQVDASSTRVHGGSGLGLSIVRNLCQAMGGSIRLESEPGKGSTFTAILPLKLEKAS